MARVNWRMNRLKGNFDLDTINRIKVDVGDAVMEDAIATVRVRRAEKMFFNGYQTWTWCPEYTRYSIIRGLRRLPNAGVRRFALDRYADYHFVKYTERRGMLHGFSYCYFRDGEKYRFFGSLNEEPGYTIFTYDSNAQRLEIRRDCAGIHASGEYPLFEFYYGEGSEQEVFDGWFKAMKVKPRKAKKLFGYSSWYNRYEDISIQSIEEDLQSCRGILKKGDLFQIDDGWEPTVGDWLEADPKKFPDGMKAICDRIHDEGYKSGIWLAPFVVTNKSTIYRDHQDWLLKYRNRNWIAGINWGGFYPLDLDHPEVREYITKVFNRVFNEWGFDMVKLDFLYAGCPFGDENRTRAGKMTDAMKWLRELCGDKLILGCGVPLMPAFGLVDYCRIGCDVGLDWDDRPYMRLIHRERVSTAHSLDNTIARRQLNGRAFGNDPDVFFLRDDNIRLSASRKEYLYTINALFSGILLTSDNFNLYDERKKELIRHVRELTQAEVIKVTDEEIVYSLKGEQKTVKRI